MTMGYTMINGRKIPTYTMEDGILAVGECLRNLLAMGIDPMVLVGAPSGTGKNYLLEMVGNAFATRGVDSNAVDGDDYYHGLRWMQANAEGIPGLCWDHPAAVDLDLVIAHAGSLKKRTPINKPMFRKQACESIGSEPLLPKRINLFGGNYLLSRKELRDMADLKIFMTASRHTRLVRRLFRDSRELNWTPAQILRYFIEVVEPMGEEFILPTMEYADMIIVNELVTEREYTRTNELHRQLKFRGTLNLEALRGKQVTCLFSGVQDDQYFNPRGYDVLAHGETVRIRRENGAVLVSNKGPKYGQLLCERSKFQFPIDEPLASIFPEFYGQQVYTISKHRTLHGIDSDIIVAVDRNVVRTDHRGRQERLGDFVEVQQIGHGEPGYEKMAQAAMQLGLNPDQAIGSDYVNI